MTTPGTKPVERRPSGPPGTGFEYGNTRLRARRSRLLAEADLQSLRASTTLDGLLGSLSGTSYGLDVERALVHRRDALHQLDEAVRSNLGRELTEVLSFYHGHAGRGVALLLGRWDLQNLLAILRSQSGLRTPDVEPSALLVAAGSVDRAAMEELLAQPSLRSTVELMVAWDLPSRPAARQVLRAWPTFQSSGDPVVLERALHEAWAAHVAEELEGWSSTGLESSLRAEIDQRNLSSALRLRASRLEMSQPGPLDDADGALAAGTLPPRTLVDVVRASTPTEVLAVLEPVPLPDDWRSALAAWSADGDLVELAGRLERAVARRAIGLFTTGDPLGIDVPVAYVWAKECEARNLRLLGRAIVHRLDWEDVRHDLYPW